MSENTSSESLLNGNGREIWTVSLTQGGVALPVSTRQILDSRREGDGLVLTLADGRVIVVQDFYAAEVAGGAVLLAVDADGSQNALGVSAEGDIERLDRDNSAVADKVAGEDAAGEDSRSAGQVSLARLEEMFGQHIREFDAFEEAAWENRVFRQANDGDGGGVGPFSRGRLVLFGGMLLVGALDGDGDDSGGDGSISPQSPGGLGTGPFGPGIVEPGPAAAPIGSDEHALNDIIDPAIAMTVSLATTAGLEGVTTRNLDNLITVLNAELDTPGVRLELSELEFAERLQRVQSLIGSVNELVDENEIIRRAESGSLLLEVDDPDDGIGDVDRVVFIEQRDDYLPSEVRIATAAAGTAPPSSSVYDITVVYDYDGSGNVVSRTIDDSGTPGVAGDGTADRIERYRVPTGQSSKARIPNEDLLEEVEIRTYQDSNADGTADSANPIRVEFNYPADGIGPGDSDGVDRSEQYQYDSLGREIQVDVDTDGNGTIDESTTQNYAANGSVETETVSIDSNQDGTFDTAVTRYYDGTGSEYDYALHDGGGAVGTPDGTPERLEFAGGQTHSLELTNALAAAFAGIGTIDMAGDADGSDGATTVTISDAHLTTLANGASSYLLVINGESDDSVVFAGDAIYRTGVTTDGRHEYHGTSGKVLVSSTVLVTGAVDPLMAVLRHLETATQPMMQLAGLTGVTADNLEHVRTVIGAYDASTTPAREALTRTQVQRLIDIVGNADYVPAEASVESASWTGNVLTLDVSVDNDSAVELRVEAALNSGSFSLQRATLRHDENSDRTYEKVEIDADGDGSYESIAYDPDEDETVDYTLTDSDGDGTPDSLAFAIGEVYDMVLGTDETAEFLGITRIYLGSRPQRSLEIDDAALTRLADRDGNGTPDSGYILTIVGDSDGTVVVGDDQIESTTDANTPSGYLVLRGTDGIIYVDDDIAVDFGRVENLQVIRENLDSNSVNQATFAAAGISGVTAANLATVKLVIGLFDDSTTPKRSNLTYAQLVNLVEIATNTSVTAGGTVEEAHLNAGGDTLTLDINANADATIERQVVLTLNSSTLAATAFVRTIDSTGDGTKDDRREEDTDYDGSLDIVIAQTDANNNGTNEEVVTETFVEGTLQTRITETDDDDDGTRDERQIEIFRRSSGLLEQRRVENNIDDDGAMVDEVTITSYEGDDAANNAISERVEIDSDDDGTADMTQVSLLDEMGRKERTAFDDNNDNILDRTEIYAFLDGSIDGVAFTLHDGGTGTDEQPDGTPDRWVFGTTDNQAVNLFSNPVLVERVAGVQEIEMPGNNKGVELTISDSVLTELASLSGTLDTSYSFTVDGVRGAGGVVDDVVAVEGEVIYRTGGTDDAGRREYRGMSAKFYVGPNVGVTGVIEPLEAALTYLGDATLATFDLIAGLTGVTNVNLNNVKTLIGAFTEATGTTQESLTLEQVQGLVDIVNDSTILAAGDTIVAPSFSAGTLVFGVDSNGDSTAEYTFVLRLNAATFAVESKVQRYDADNDGTFERSRLDIDNDGTVDQINYDPNDDGTIEYSLYDGTGTEDKDGTMDRLAFTDGNTYEMEIGTSEAEDFAGIGTIDLAGRDGVIDGITTLTISNAMLTELADGASNYQLVINGGGNDRVIFGGGIHESGTDDANGRNSYQGTDATVLVSNTVTVEGAQSLLARILENLETATLDMFGAANIVRVYSSNLENVRKVVGAYNANTNPSRSELTQPDVQALVDLVNDARVVPVGSSIDSASVRDSTRSPLTLTFTDHTVMVVLDSSFRIAGLITERDFRRDHDVDLDGTLDSIEYRNARNEINFKFFDDAAGSADDGTLDQYWFRGNTVQRYFVSFETELVKELFGAINNEIWFFTVGEFRQMVDSIERFLQNNVTGLSAVSVAEADGTTTLTFDYEINTDGTVDGSAEVKIYENYRLMTVLYDSDRNGSVNYSETYTYDGTGLHYVSFDFNGADNPDIVHISPDVSRDVSLADIHMQSVPHRNLSDLTAVDLRGSSMVNLTISGTFVEDVDGSFQVFGDANDTVRLGGGEWEESESLSIVGPIDGGDGADEEFKHFTWDGTYEIVVHADIEVEIL